MSTGIGVLGAVWFGAAAQAARPVWAWPEGEHRRYYLESHGMSPGVLMLHAPQNHQLRFSRYEVAMVVDCTASGPAVARQQSLRCDIEALGVRIGAMQRDLHQVQPVLSQFEELSSGLWLQLVVRDDGKLVTIDLEGYDASQDRQRRALEDLRLLLMRAVVGLELKQPDDPLAKPWKDKSPRIAQPIGRIGAMARVEHKAAPGRSDGTLEIASTGEVSLRNAGGGPNTQDTLRGELQSTTMWDAQAHAMVGRLWWVDLHGMGVTVQRPDGSLRRAPQAAIQAGLVLHVPDGEDAPAVGPWGMGGFRGRSYTIVKQKLTAAAAGE